MAKCSIIQLIAVMMDVFLYRKLRYTLRRTRRSHQQRMHPGVEICCVPAASSASTWGDGALLAINQYLATVTKEITPCCRKCRKETWKDINPPWTTQASPRYVPTTSQVQAMRSGIYKLDSSRRKYLGRPIEAVAKVEISCI